MTLTSLHSGGVCHRELEEHESKRQALQDLVRLRCLVTGMREAGEPAFKTVQILMLAPSRSQQSTEAVDCREVAGQ